MRTPPIPRLVLYALTVVLAVTLVVAASTTTAAFGAYNIEWDGTSDFRELTDQETESRIALETDAYESVAANETVAVALAPAETYGENDSTRVRAFVEAGGTLVVADDVGPHGNRLLADVGATARFDGAQLRDERSYYRAPSLPVATAVRETPYTVGVERLTLNGATAIEPGPARENATVSGNLTGATNESPGNVTVVAATSPFGYLDRNATGDLSPDDELGAYPVVTVESVGDGRVVAVSDPSLFINSMLSEPDNAAFAAALVNSADRVLLDYSHSGDQPPLAVALLEFRSAEALQIAVGMVGVGAVWWYGYRGPGSARSARRRISGRLPRRWQLPRRWRRRIPAWLLGPGPESDQPSIDDGAVLDALRRRYPGWDESRLRSAMTDVLPDRNRREEDE